MKIIAEIGSNWTEPEDISVSIRAAKECGAHAVKFQYFNGSDLYGPGHSTPICQPDLVRAKQWADIFEIELMCTAFSPESVKFVDQFVSCHKIASAEMEYKDLLSAVLSTGKDFYLSTGGHTLKEVEAILKWLDLPENGSRLTLMYCDAIYPSRVTNPKDIYELQSFGYPVGLSDHSMEIYSTRWIAEQTGCVAIEKHVNLCGVEDTADAPHSLTYKEFRRFCGKAEPYLKDGERSMRLKHNRRPINGGFYRKA